MIINHELIHAYHFSHVTNPTAYVKGRISERVASTYSYVYAREVSLPLLQNLFIIPLLNTEGLSILWSGVLEKFLG